jgi:PKHD-type hydroxylase
MIAPRYYYVDNALSEKDCDDFIANYKDVEFTKGKTDDNVLKDNRKANVHWLGVSNILTRAVWSYILEINSNSFWVNLSGYRPAQLTKYDNKGVYEWHRDNGTTDPNGLGQDGSVRKLSAVLQLSKPENYKGCELQLFNGIEEPEELPIKNQGSLIIFKSEEWHRVTELTEGTRYSLVMWAHGPEREINA